MSIYSTLLWLGTVQSGDNVLYTATGVTAVLRDVEVSNTTSSGLSVQLILRQASGFNDAVVIVTPTIASNASWQWEGRIVIPPAAHIDSYAGTAGLGAALSGYQFS